ncbi:uncharacterized protein [Spinacia oleracea]|uniref:Uncharacterized protein isoform X1 n=1 Tax=Spinacia oleracea TaxID=3562 RepID=A0ABM3QHA8_SPIOL|nr:uncharacterized protein LOC110780046 isoform X1 [Spinacia oleracea]
MSNRIYFQVLLLKFLIQIPLAIGYFSSFFSHLFSCYLVCSRIHKFGHQLSRQLQFEFIERRCFFSDFFRSAADMTNFSFYSRVVVFGAVFSCTGVASCCCRVWVVLLMCAGCSAGSPGVAVRSTGSVVFDCCCVQSYVAYPFIAFVVFGC